MREQSNIHVRGLTKSFGDNLVLDGIDLDVPSGSVFALLGPNGAGKTTLVRILSTLIGFDGGRASVAGWDVVADPDRVRASIGVTGQFSALDDLLTAEENLMLMADLYHLPPDRGRQRVADLLAQFELEDVAGDVPSTFSGGMRRRLDLAMGLVSTPRIVFLDEPTTGLDPRGRHTMWQSIRRLASEDVTVFLTTQYLEEADRLADRVALLDEGSIVAEGTPDELKRLVPGGHVSLVFTEPSALETAASVFSDNRRNDELLSLEVPSDGSIASLREVLGQVESSSIDVTSLAIHTPDLDDVFFALTGRRDKEAAK